MLIFDHIAITAKTLNEGCEWVEKHLGIAPGPGGVHPLMGTHNRLLGLGRDAYLEVIAVDPGAPTPGRPRWFDLDNFSGPPRITNWVVRTDDMAGDLALLPVGTGTPMALSRGDLRWTMAVPDDGRLPFEGACPALIQWSGTAHPAQNLPDTGLRLSRFEVVHPHAGQLRNVLGTLLTDQRLMLAEGDEMAIRATFDTPHGERVLE